MTTDSFVIYPDVCPVGYSLRQGTLHNGYECRCKDIQEILNCEDDQDTILIRVRSFLRCTMIIVYMIIKRSGMP